jgi:hypothetical protein
VKRKQQSRDELANEMFGTLTSDTDNNTMTSSTSSPIIMMKKQPAEKETTKKNIEIPDVKEVLNEYFKLKQKYENQIMINKKKSLIIHH